ncbi:uncharacterized protein LOC143287668 [Babylonia areolata]|uniref:uncharacterized protein LOC143287668 n=1 Tax=Babylonia areolata TaxID=304850 RepID=UPI003FD596CB
MLYASIWLMHAHLLFIGIMQTSSESSLSTSSTHHKQLSACRIQLGAKENVINLEPLARKDGFPRFVAEYENLNHPWNYSFNPCADYSVPWDNPHTGFGDGCHSVSICKYTSERDQYYYYTLGIHASAKFRVSVDDTKKRTVELVYKAIKSMRSRSTIIKLVCSEKRTGMEDGKFVITKDTGKGPLYAELHHQCCCVGGCWNADSEADDDDDDDVDEEVAIGSSRESSASKKKKGGKKDDEGLMLIVIGTVIAIVMLVALIGGLCYVKRTQMQIYSKLPGKSNDPGISLAAKRNFCDYEPTGLAQKKLLPVLEDTMIHMDSLEMCQRLGGGLFGDSHLAKWNGMTVAVKRLTLLVHENQVTPEAMKLMKNEVWFLSRQRHKNIVTILGLCLDGKLPSIITEYVVGECLKDFLKVQGRLLSWPHRVRICSQVADGMAFLHTAKPPIIHRDLRCGNIFLLDNDVIKVADFGLIKMLQPIRQECPQDDCCCRRTMSACPASIRWTAPELLAHPTTKERLVPPAQGKGGPAGSSSSSKGGGQGQSEEVNVITTCLRRLLLRHGHVGDHHVSRPL